MTHTDHLNTDMPSTFISDVHSALKTTAADIKALMAREKNGQLSPDATSRLLEMREMWQLTWDAMISHTLLQSDTLRLHQEFLQQPYNAQVDMEAMDARQRRVMAMAVIRATLDQHLDRYLAAPDTPAGASISPAPKGQRSPFSPVAPW